MFKCVGGDDVQQLCEAGEEEFLEIMSLVGMASKPLHVRRLQKALQEWVSNPRECSPPSYYSGGVAPPDTSFSSASSSRNYSPDQWHRLGQYHSSSSSSVASKPPSAYGSMYPSNVVAAPQNSSYDSNKTTTSPTYRTTSSIAHSNAAFDPSAKSNCLPQYQSSLNTVRETRPDYVQYVNGHKKYSDPYTYRNGATRKHISINDKNINTPTSAILNSSTNRESPINYTTLQSTKARETNIYDKLNCDNSPPNDSFGGRDRQIVRKVESPSEVDSCRTTQIDGFSNQDVKRFSASPHSGKYSSRSCSPLTISSSPTSDATTFKSTLSPTRYVDSQNNPRKRYVTNLYKTENKLPKLQKSDDETPRVPSDTVRRTPEDNATPHTNGEERLSFHDLDIASSINYKNSERILKPSYDNANSNDSTVDKGKLSPKSQSKTRNHKTASPPNLLHMADSIKFSKDERSSSPCLVNRLESQDTTTSKVESGGSNSGTINHVVAKQDLSLTAASLLSATGLDARKNSPLNHTLYPANVNADPQNIYKIWGNLLQHMNISKESGLAQRIGQADNSGLGGPSSVDATQSYSSADSPQNFSLKVKSPDVLSISADQIAASK